MINDAIIRNSDEFTGYYERSRTALLNLLGEQSFSNVLEIGCGGGANLAELKRRMPNCRTTGVELRADAADVALVSGRVDVIKVGSILDEAEVDFPVEKFDLIILSHVLEHFVEPEFVLHRVIEWLAPNGHFLVALPNVRHLSVLRELLLNGDFKYRSSGILDNTHLRFFTSKSAKRFLTKQGLTVERHAPDVEGRKSELLNAITFGMASDFTAFAHNFLLRKS